MTTATHPTLIDVKGRSACYHGHEWTEETVRRDKCGVWRCRICSTRSQAGHRTRKANGDYHRRVERNLPDPPREAAPEVRWHVYRLSEMEKGLPASYILRLLQYWFVRKMSHSPEVLKVSHSRAKALQAAAKGNSWQPTIVAAGSVGEDWIGAR